MKDQLLRAWAWVTGLRITTRRERDHMAALVKRYQSDASRAHAEKREAQRVLAILSEPMKDWDLADFPRDGAEGSRHLNAIVQAYGIVARDAAHARMTVTANDKLRGRGWGDQAIPATRPAPRDPRRLP